MNTRVSLSETMELGCRSLRRIECVVIFVKPNYSRDLGPALIFSFVCGAGVCNAYAPFDKDRVSITDLEIRNGTQRALRCVLNS